MTFANKAANLPDCEKQARKRASHLEEDARCMQREVDMANLQQDQDSNLSDGSFVEGEIQPVQEGTVAGAGEGRRAGESCEGDDGEGEKGLEESAIAIDQNPSRGYIGNTLHKNAILEKSLAASRKASELAASSNRGRTSSNGLRGMQMPMHAEARGRNEGKKREKNCMKLTLSPKR
ncbi:hypothetical protein TWF225_000282 [Orbilia oligospora]|uniref:Uncharacterized protein n=1 Tax=Orbilia oligospora TaxID=2813651 RepID=A0A7C8TZ63_ORBOL|nr:hypothetical protein TWF751_004317 [Orbilia oligospora]KAF3195922.1 hypothetical protein TWF225_000282 [Orbilia oligospora]KAF3266505.1 hypothetical protein TWF128_010897 [Orbilia oligospora]KAF3272169.1 hypothetical protein TWF217_003973 [Orbilia oligospora]KAF3297665.1 hypothetical protein TWF132_006072 [Orbilia oligospora]